MIEQPTKQQAAPLPPHVLAAQANRAELNEQSVETATQLLPQFVIAARDSVLRDQGSRLGAWAWVCVGLALLVGCLVAMVFGYFADSYIHDLYYNSKIGGYDLNNMGDEAALTSFGAGIAVAALPFVIGTICLTKCVVAHLRSHSYRAWATGWTILLVPYLLLTAFCALFAVDIAIANDAWYPHAAFTKAASIVGWLVIAAIMLVLTGQLVPLLNRWRKPQKASA